MLKPAMQSGAEATKALFAELKIRPAVIDLPVEFRKDEVTFRDGLAKLGEQAQFAAAIGCLRMVTYIMSSSDTPKAELRSLYKQRFTECAKAGGIERPAWAGVSGAAAHAQTIQV